MYINNVLAAGALLSLALAIPLQQQQHEQRDIVTETKVAVDIVTSIVTTTIWVQPSPMFNAHMPHGHGGRFHPSPQITSHVTRTITVQPQVAPSPPVNSEPAAPPAPPPASNPPAPVSQSPDASPAPPPQPSAPPPQPPPSQPPSNPQPSAKPSPSSPPSGGGAPPSGQKETGDLTFYTPGLGSCGITNSASDMIVALAEDMMLADWPSPNNPNDNPNCGKSITISHNGVTAVATIEDTCPGCSGAGLDLTPTLFEKFGPLSEGRISGVQWWFN